MKILILLFVLATTAFSSGGAVATITNPTSALNEFVFSVDLSLMPAEWWAQVSDTSGMKMLCYKSTGTRLPIDLVWIDTSAHQGCLKGMWTGTLASSGTQQVIVFPPDSGRSVTLPTDPYGKNSVYSNYIAYYPLDGNGNERSGNAYDLTVSGAIDTIGHNCRALRFDGVDDYAAEGASKIPPTEFQTSFTLSYWEYSKSVGEGSGRLIDKTDALSATTGFAVYRTSTPSYSGIVTGGSIFAAGAVVPFSSWNYITVIFSDSNYFYINGTMTGTPKASGMLSSITSTSPLTLGNRSGATDRSFDGVIDDVQIVSGVKSDDWSTEEYLMESDQSTFWGTWTYVKVDITSIEPDSAAIGSQAYLKGIFLGLTFQPGDSLTISTAKAPITAVNDTAVFYTVPNVSEGFYGDTTIVCAAGICDTLVGDSIYFYRAPSSSRRRSHWSGWRWNWAW